jgi:hypothetical protein
MVRQNACRQHSSSSCTLVTFLGQDRVSNLAWQTRRTVLQVKADNNTHATWLSAHIFTSNFHYISNFITFPFVPLRSTVVADCQLFPAFPFNFLL